MIWLPSSSGNNYYYSSLLKEIDHENFKLINEFYDKNKIDKQLYFIHKDKLIVDDSINLYTSGPFNPLNEVFVMSKVEYKPE